MLFGVVGRIDPRMCNVDGIMLIPRSKLPPRKGAVSGVDMERSMIVANGGNCGVAL